MQRLGHDGFARLALEEILLAGDFREDVVVIVTFAVFTHAQRSDGEFYAVGVEIVEFERFAFHVGYFKRHYRPPVVGNRHGGDRGLESALRGTLAVTRRRH